MPCILHYNTKKISNTIYRQVSDQAQLPDVLKFNLDKESKPYKSGGVTSSEGVTLMYIDQAHVTTKTQSEPSVTAWIVGGLLCFVGAVRFYS